MMLIKFQSLRFILTCGRFGRPKKLDNYGNVRRISSCDESVRFWPLSYWNFHCFSRPIDTRYYRNIYLLQKVTTDKQAKIRPPLHRSAQNWETDFLRDWMMHLIGDIPKYRELRRTEKMCTGILYDYSLSFSNEDEPEFLAVTTSTRVSMAFT